MDDRAQIAAMALQGIVSSTDEDGLPLAGPNFAAARAIEYADALLEALRLSSKNPPPARTKETPRPPTDPGESEAGEHERGCVVPRGDGLAVTRGTAGFDLAPDSMSRPATAGTNPASPCIESVWDCEARFEHDPVCPGLAEFDHVTRGWFCPLHLTAVPEGHRREMHRLHGHRNRPLAPVARLAG